MQIKSRTRNKQPEYYAPGGFAIFVILMVPVIGDLIRKFLPGQPNWLVAGFGTFTMLLVFFWLLKRPSRLKIPGTFAKSLSLWFIFGCAYAIPGAFVDWRILPVTFFFRLLPMFLALFAYRVITSPNDFTFLARFASFIPIILMPIGIISLIAGNEALPDFLQPTEQIRDQGRDFRVGFSMCSTIFSTAPIMANSMSALFFLILASYFMPDKYHKKYDKKLFLLAIIGSLILTFASTRRGDFLLLLSGLTYSLYLGKKMRVQIFVAAIALFIVLALLDNQSSAKKEFIYEKRSQFMFSNLEEMNERINGIFIGSMIDWMNERPFGHYLGWAGREAELFAPGSANYRSVETGGAQLIAETGIIGAILMPLSLIIAWVKIWKKSNKNEYKNSIRILVLGAIGLYILFYCKAISALSSLYLAQMFFWMVPGIALALCKKKVN